MQSVLYDIFFVTLVGFGFGYACNPPLKTLIFTALLAAIGHGFRLILLSYFHVHMLAFATFLASLLIGALGILIARFIRVPAEIIAFPALLPMIPGIYAYHAILSLFSFIKSDDISAKSDFLVSFFDNFFTALSVSLALGVGVSITLIIFFEQTFMVTRHRR